MFPSEKVTGPGPDRRAVVEKKLVEHKEPTLTKSNVCKTVLSAGDVGSSAVQFCVRVPAVYLQSAEVFILAVLSVWRINNLRSLLRNTRKTERGAGV
jgi:hypothetical protein